jgi:hypothetical protein
MKSAKPVNYPDPVIFDNERLIFARFDGANGTALNVPIFFSNSDVLANKIITGIDVKFDLVEGLGTDSIQTDIGFIGTITDANKLSYFTITLVGKNGDILLNDYPLANFCRLYNAGKIRRTSMIIDLSKSYIRNFGLTVGVTSKFVIPINFYYKNK